MQRTTTDNNNTGAAQERRQQAPSSAFRIKDMLFLCLSNWQWFVLSLAITVGAAFYYLQRTPKEYLRTAAILIKQENQSQGAEQALKELAMMHESTNVTNEILSLKSSTTADEIVRRLKLDVCYYRDNNLYNEVTYGLELPVEVQFPDLADNQTASLTLTIGKDSTVTLSDIVLHGRQLVSPVTMKLGQTAKTSAGRITVLPSPFYQPGKADELLVERLEPGAVAADLSNRLSVQLREKNSTIIDLAYQDKSTERAEDVLNTLVNVYGENWVKDRNQRIVSTNEFIKERLSVIERELGNVESDISSYKSANLVPDVQAVGSIALTEASATEQENRDLNNQLYMIRFIRSNLTDGMHDNQLLPSNSGLSSSNITSQIAEYNDVMLQRNKHLANSSAQNPLVIDLNEHLSNLRNLIIKSLDDEQTIINAAKTSVQRQHGSALSRIASNPQQAKYLLSVERQQKVKESLYLYLLQKREENELTQAFTAYNTQIIESPHGSNAPVSPVRNNIIALAVILGLAIPGAIIFTREGMNTSIRGRKDFEHLQVPFAGEIPQAILPAAKKGWFGRKKVEKADPELLVKADSRNVMNEAFRVVRTNLEFILGFETSHRIIMLTSMNPGSGKTFISANLSTALAIKGQRVLAIDLDMRKGSLSEYVGSPKHGISNYLSGQEASYKDLLVKLGEVDVLPCGTLPPNPSELLFSPRFKAMIDEVREAYDYVFIDCPPAEFVADAAIINRYVDLTLFVVRAHLMDRSLLPEIEEWYDRKKFRNLAIILNGTSDAFSHYGYHKYGYRYGYHYGRYGSYGYGYGESDKRKKSSGGKSRSEHATRHETEPAEV